jgi:extradiol dioxygenase family protein
MQPFHLAIPVTDLIEAANFYETMLGASKGRESSTWTDYNFFGHQLVCHLVENRQMEFRNPVDEDDIPVPHFGIVLTWDSFHELAGSLTSKNFTFFLEPKIRFEGEVGEQATMFIKDPSNNAIEFKAFKDIDNLFKS